MDSNADEIADEIVDAHDSRIGNLNGPWSVLFRSLLTANAFLVPALLGWGIWVTTQLYAIQSHLAVQTGDRFSAAMFIEVQDALAEKNPNMTWLNASEIRSIQRNNPPYRQ